jgi:hypothetical protein
MPPAVWSNALSSFCRTSGRYRVRWDGQDGQGRRLPTGVYVVRLTDGADLVTEVNKSR